MRSEEELFGRWVALKLAGDWRREERAWAHWNAVANEDISSLPSNALIDPLNHIVPKRPV
jgi:hypothetical protein